jgi:hypothetical protein
MSTQNLFIPGGMTYGVNDLEKKEGENQRFEVIVPDGRPNRIIEYTKYDTWEQVEGIKLLPSHLELLGNAIKKNFNELFK